MSDPMLFNIYLIVSRLYAIAMDIYLSVCSLHRLIVPTTFQPNLNFQYNIENFQYLHVKRDPLNSKQTNVVI